MDRLNALFAQKSNLLSCEILWLVSNLGCDGNSIALKLVQNDIMNSVIAFLRSADLNVKTQAFYVVGNILTTLQNYEDIFRTLDHFGPDLLKNYVAGLEMISNETLLNHVLDTIDFLLQVDVMLGLKDENSFLFRFEMAQGLDRIEELQKVPNEHIYQRVCTLIEKYIGIDEQISFGENSHEQRQSNI